MRISGGRTTVLGVGVGGGVGGGMLPSACVRARCSTAESAFTRGSNFGPSPLRPFSPSMPPNPSAAAGGGPAERAAAAAPFPPVAASAPAAART